MAVCFEPYRLFLCRSSRRVNDVPEFEAYGVSVHSDLDLGAYLPLASPRQNVRSIEVHESPAPPLIPAVRLPFAYSHDRQLTAMSNQAFRGAIIGQSWWLEIEGTATFHWTVGQPFLSYEPGPAGNSEALSFWLIHTVLPAFLALEGTYHFLHAAASSIDGKAVLILGPSGSGKSTLLSSLLAQDCALISDDKVAILKQDGQFSAVTSHSRYRPYRRHLDLGLKARSISRNPLPLRALLRLIPAEPDTDIRFIDVHGADKFNLVLEQLLFAFSESAAVHFGFLADLVSQVTVTELHVPQDLERLKEISEAVVRRFQP